METAATTGDSRPSASQETAEEFFERWQREEDEARVVAGLQLAEILAPRSPGTADLGLSRRWLQRLR